MAVNVIVENLQSIQGNLCVGYKSQGLSNKGDIFYSLLVFNEILGGGSVSKLFDNVREKESLCYGINSCIYRFKLLMLINSGVEGSKLDYVKDLVVRETEKLAEGDFTDQDIEKAKAGLVKKYRGVLDYPSSLMDFYVTGKLLDDPDEIDDVVQRINRVTRENICKCGKALVLDTIFIGGNDDYKQQGN